MACCICVKSNRVLRGSNVCAKLVRCGLAIEAIAAKLATEVAMQTVKVGTALQTVMIFSGLLPLCMPILWLTWTCDMVVIWARLRGRN